MENSVSPTELSPVKGVTPEWVVLDHVYEDRIDFFVHVLDLLENDTNAPYDFDEFKGKYVPEESRISFPDLASAEEYRSFFQGLSAMEAFSCLPDEYLQVIGLDILDVPEAVNLLSQGLTPDGVQAFLNSRGAHYYYLPRSVWTVNEYGSNKFGFTKKFCEFYNDDPSILASIMADVTLSALPHVIQFFREFYTSFMADESRMDNMKEQISYACDSLCDTLIKNDPFMVEQYRLTEKLDTLNEAAFLLLEESIQNFIFGIGYAMSRD